MEYMAWSRDTTHQRPTTWFWTTIFLTWRTEHQIRDISNFSTIKVSHSNIMEEETIRIFDTRSFGHTFLPRPSGIPTEYPAAKLEAVILHHHSLQKKHLFLLKTNGLISSLSMKNSETRFVQKFTKDLFYRQELQNCKHSSTVSAIESFLATNFWKTSEYALMTNVHIVRIKILFSISYSSAQRQSYFGTKSAAGSPQKSTSR